MSTFVIEIRVVQGKGSEVRGKVTLLRNIGSAFLRSTQYAQHSASIERTLAHARRSTAPRRAFANHAAITKNGVQRKQKQ